MFRFNTLGGRSDIEAVGHVKNRADDRGVTVRREHPLYKGAVGLDTAQRVSLEEAE